ncbi:hypothetical protein MHK_002369 [Candidatus Magnetomorum sp. HK-1]|nr:hypothetical protein MHK_002369 [Candidatus Magnetomorum sp. HK-1]
MVKQQNWSVIIIIIFFETVENPNHTKEIMEIFVIGMHRSGTSLVSGFLHQMGIYLGPDSQFLKDKHNPKGYFESPFVKDINSAILNSLGFAWDNIGSFDPEVIHIKAKTFFYEKTNELFKKLNSFSNWGIKDPRICLLFNLWKTRLKKPVCIFVVRHPLSVAKSIKKRNNYPLDFGLALWEKYTVLALNSIHNIPTIFVHFEKIQTNPSKEIIKLYQQLKKIQKNIKPPNLDKLLSFFDKELIHHKKNLTIMDNPFMTNFQRELYDKLLSHQVEQKKITVSRQASKILSQQMLTTEKLKNIISTPIWDNLLSTSIYENIPVECEMIRHKPVNILDIGNQNLQLLKQMFPQSQLTKIIDVKNYLLNKIYNETIIAENPIVIFEDNYLCEKKFDTVFIGNYFGDIEFSKKWLVSLKAFLTSGSQVISRFKNLQNLSKFHNSNKNNAYSLADIITLFQQSGYHINFFKFEIDKRFYDLYRNFQTPKYENKIQVNGRKISIKSQQELIIFCSSNFYINADPLL